MKLGLMLNGTWRNGRRNALTGNDPEKVTYVQTKPNETGKGGLKTYIMLK